MADRIDALLERAERNESFSVSSEDALQMASRVMLGLREEIRELKRNPEGYWRGQWAKEAQLRVALDDQKLKALKRLGCPLGAANRERTAMATIMEASGILQEAVAPEAVKDGGGARSMSEATRLNHQYKSQLEKAKEEIASLKKEFKDFAICKAVVALEKAWKAGKVDIHGDFKLNVTHEDRAIAAENRLAESTKKIVKWNDVLTTVLTWVAGMASEAKPMVKGGPKPEWNKGREQAEAAIRSILLNEGGPPDPPPPPPGRKHG